MAKRDTNFDDQDMNGGNSPCNRGWKGTVQGLKNLAKTGTLYKQEVKDDQNPRTVNFPSNDKPFLAENEPPEGK